MDGNKLLADIIMWVLSQDVVAPEFIAEKFSISETTARNISSTLIEMKLISVPDTNGFMFVQIHESSQLDSELIEFLTKNGYTESDILKNVDVPNEHKEEYSKILDPELTKCKWNDIMAVDPPVNTPCLIRLRHRDKLILNMKSTIGYVEDCKLAVYDGKEWSILPPFMKYDFSPLSCKSSIKEEAIVTHWAVATDEDIDIWNKRCKPINEYKKLILDVDEYNEESVYDALIVAGAALASYVDRTAEDDPIHLKFESAHNIICDLQAAIDLGGIKDAVEEKSE